MNKLFDRRLIAKRKRRAMLQPISGSDFLMHRACEDLADRLAVVERQFDHAVSLFSGHQHVIETLRQSGKIDRITRIEMDRQLLGDEAGIVESEEVLPLQEAGSDLIVSLFAVHEINDVPGLLAQIRRALKPDGLFLAAFAGANTLSELRDCLIAAETELTGGASARIYPFMDVRDAGALLQRAGFALPVVDIETAIARYDMAESLMRDIRAMGAASALADRPRQMLTREILARTNSIYAKRYADADKRLRATFNIIWMSGWVPHHSQQKPLEPGSATTRMEDALRKFEEND